MADQPHCAYCKRELTGGDWPAPWQADDGGTTCAASPTSKHEPAGRL